MVDFDLDQSFGLAIAPFRSFQSIRTPEAQRRCLACVHGHLDPGARLVLHLFDTWLDRLVPGAKSPIERADFPYSDTGRLVTVEIMDRNTDPMSQMIEEVWRLTETSPEGQTVRQEEALLAVRWTYRREMQYLLELTGFTVEAQYGDFKGAPPAYGKEQVWVAQRCDGA